MAIIIDTNFILTCVKQKIDLFSQLEDLFPGRELLMPQKVLEELMMLSESDKLSGREKEAASLALKIIENTNVSFLEFRGNVDDAIVNYAKAHREAIVASLDREMKKRIGKASFLTIRGGRRIDLD